MWDVLTGHTTAHRPGGIKKKKPKTFVYMLGQGTAHHRDTLGPESFENITTEARVTSLNDPLFSLAKKSKRSGIYIHGFSKRKWVFAHC